jgi:hypothetical protein
MSVQCFCGSWDHEPFRHPTTAHDTADRRCSCGELLTCPLATPAPLDERQAEEIAAGAVLTERARHAALVAAARAFIDWYDQPGRSYIRDGSGPAAIRALRAALDGEPT